MDLSRILSAPDPQPRGTKRASDGSPRTAFATQQTQQLPSPRSTECVLRSDPVNFQYNTAHRAMLNNSSPARNHGDAPNSRTSSTHYGSSPFRSLFQARNAEEFDTLLDRIDGLPPEHARSSRPHGPGADIWQALERASPDASIRSTTPYESSDAGTMGQRLSVHNDDDDDTASSTFSGDSLFEDSSHSMEPRHLGEIDLTQDTDPMSPEDRNSQQRKRRHREVDGLDDGDPGPSNYRPSSGSKRARTNTNSTAVESISLLDDDDNPAAASLLSKQRADQIHAQNAASPGAYQSASEKPKRPPTKLTGLQCTICMDEPHELTATTCGHVFCRECIQGWLGAPDARGRGKNCPACRTGLNAEDVGRGRGRKGTRGACVALEFMRKKDSTTVQMNAAR
ncbi:MAG: hypothetical protein Q9159_006053 [Coniocarpon cinnabarinum]